MGWEILNISRQEFFVTPNAQCFFFQQKKNKQTKKQQQQESVFPS